MNIIDLKYVLFLHSTDCHQPCQSRPVSQIGKESPSKATIMFPTTGDFSLSLKEVKLKLRPYLLSLPLLFSAPPHQTANQPSALGQAAAATAATRAAGRVPIGCRVLGRRLAVEVVPNGLANAAVAVEQEDQRQEEVREGEPGDVDLQGEGHNRAAWSCYAPRIMYLGF